MNKIAYIDVVPELKESYGFGLVYYFPHDSGISASASWLMIL